METRKKNEVQDVDLFTLRISRKQIRLMTIVFTITFIVGVVLFFLMDF
jgi:hypothetical protein